MANRSELKKKRSAQAAYMCGVAFQHLAEQFIPCIGLMKEEITQEMSNEMGNLVACATNLGFAVELYLKALLTQLDEPVPIGHDLCALYGRIPQQVRTVIEKVYDLQLHKQARLLHGHMGVTLAKGPLGKPSWDDYKVSRALPDLLARSRDLFQSWRYIFEFTQPEDATYQFHQFEYGFLWCAAEAIRVEIKVRSSGIGKKGMGTL